MERKAYEVKTRETVYRVYSVMAQNADEARDSVEQGEVAKFNEVDAEIDMVIYVKEIE